MDLDSQGAIPLGAQNMDEQDSSCARSTAPNRPFRISCKTDEGKVSIPPRIAHASSYVSCCKIAAEINALSLHPELAHIVGLVYISELEPPYMSG
jgi:hypothetical protein